MFVTALAWAFIGLGATGGCLFALFSFISDVSLRIAGAGNTLMQRQMQDVIQAVNTLPAPWPWIYAHQAQLMLLASAVALLHLVCALGLLWRRRWARTGFIALMMLDIPLQLLTIPYAYVLQPAITRATMVRMPAQLPAFDAWMQHVMAFQQIEGLLRPVLLSLVFAWIAWRLRKPAIRAEFGRPPTVHSA